MTNLSILLVALQCVIYIYSKISGVDSRPPDYEPTGPFTEAVSWSKLRAFVFDLGSLDNRKTWYLFQTKDVKEHKEYLQREVVPILKKKFNRLPGVCRRLKRRRITILVFTSCLLLCDKYDFCVYSAGKSHYTCKIYIKLFSVIFSVNLWDVIFYSCFILIKFHPKTLGFVNPKLGNSGFKSMCRQKFLCAVEKNVPLIICPFLPLHSVTQKSSVLPWHTLSMATSAPAQKDQSALISFYGVCDLCFYFHHKTHYIPSWQNHMKHKLRQTIPYSHLFLSSLSRTGNVTHLSWKYPLHFR